jgi:hypothetical protein
LDSSISISEIYFKPVREFLIDLIKKLKIGPDGAHLGLITFSSKEKTRRLLDVGQIQNQSKLIEWLKERNYTTELKGDTTRTDLALKIANEVSHSKSRKKCFCNYRTGNAS